MWIALAIAALLALAVGISTSSMLGSFVVLLIILLVWLIVEAVWPQALPTTLRLLPPKSEEDVKSGVEKIIRSGARAITPSDAPPSPLIGTNWGEVDADPYGFYHYNLIKPGYQQIDNLNKITGSKVWKFPEISSLWKTPSTWTKQWSSRGKFTAQGSIRGYNFTYTPAQDNLAWTLPYWGGSFKQKWEQIGGGDTTIGNGCHFNLVTDKEGGEIKIKVLGNNPTTYNSSTIWTATYDKDGKVYVSPVGESVTIRSFKLYDKADGGKQLTKLTDGAKVSFHKDDDQNKNQLTVKLIGCVIGGGQCPADQGTSEGADEEGADEGADEEGTGEEGVDEGTDEGTDNSGADDSGADETPPAPETPPATDDDQPGLLTRVYNTFSSIF